MRFAIGSAISLTLVLSILTFSGVAWYFHQKPDQIIQKRRHLEILLEASRRVSEVWRQAPPNGCRPENLEILSPLTLWRGKEKVEIGIILGPWKARQKEKHYLIPHLSYRVELSYGGEKLVLLLDHNCHQAFLPQRQYAYGEPKRRTRDEFRWDNFNQHIFIDQFTVSNRDIQVWDRLGLAPKGISYNQKNPNQPALLLNQKEMQDYCSFRGKQVMEAHLWDAASFHPFDVTNPRPKTTGRNPYPWTRKKKTFLEKAQLNPGEIFHPKYCQKILTRECPQSPLNQSMVSRSWMGMYQVLGGEMEYLRNSIQPKHNLKVSSRHFKFSSTWHRIGVRAYWDGEGHGPRNFHWKRGSAPDDYPLGIAFRCYRRLP